MKNEEKNGPITVTIKPPQPGASDHLAKAILKVINEKKAQRPTLFPDDTARVRESDPATSHEAADSNNVPRSHRLVLAAFSLRPVSGWAQFEVEQMCVAELSPSRIRSAFSELEALGKVKRTDQFRLTPSGRRAQVWSLT